MKKSNTAESPKKISKGKRKESNIAPAASSSKSPLRTPQKKEETPEECKWWKKESRTDGKFWDSLEHKGPIFYPPYERLPEDVLFLYGGQEMLLSESAEEVARFYAELLDSDRTSEEKFNENFFEDWRRSMSDEERSVITKLAKCDFEGLQKHCKEETRRIKQALDEQKQEYGFCVVDGRRHKISNCKVEPPGLFQPTIRADPKAGKVKKRVRPEDVTINCSAGMKPPAPPGHEWGKVICDPTVRWLAKWTDTLRNKDKYVELDYDSPVKGKTDWEKYQTARRLHQHIEAIRASYREAWESPDIKTQQLGVALYFIDKFAFRVGHEREGDTVGCCTLRTEHIKLHQDNEDCVVSFDFREKGGTHYKKEVTIEERPFRNLQTFIENRASKKSDLFDRIDATILNNRLKTFMPGLTARVFRTYNASLTLQQKLDEFSDPNADLAKKLLVYKEAVHAAATLCNHQRTGTSTKPRSLEDSMQQLCLDKNKIINTTTTRIYYLDPQIAVAWCLKHDIPIERIFTTKEERDKFYWASDMAERNYRFVEIGPSTRKRLF